MTKFQHRHYAAVADVLADAREALQGSSNAVFAADNTLEDIEDRFVRMFKGDNYKFSESRFRAAARRSPDMHGKDKVA